MPLTLSSPYTRSEWPVAVRVDFGDLGAPGIVDPRTIYVATPTGSILPLNLTDSPNIYWLVFPANLTSEGATYYIYFDTRYRLQARPPPYPVGLARPVSGAVEEAHTNPDLEALGYGSGWGGNWYALLVAPRGYIEPPPSGGSPAGPGEVSLGFTTGYYNLNLTSVYVDPHMAVFAPGSSGQPGASGIASTPVIAALWGDVEANDTRIQYTYSTHGGRLFRVWWAHSEVRLPEGWLEGWEYRLPITVTWTGTDTLADVVVAVNLTGASSVFQHAKQDGSDLRFALPNGTLLQAYPVEWDPQAGVGLFYVKIPTLSPGETTLYLYYGNPQAGAYWSTPQGLGLKRGYNPGASNLETVNNWYPSKSDLYQSYWADAGRDAFDGFGYPTLSYNGRSYSLPMGPGSRIPLETWVDLGDFRVHVRVFFADDVEHNGIGDDLVWAIELIPDQNYQGQAVNVWLHGNLGSDSSTSGPYTFTATLADGSTVTFYMTNDDGKTGTGGDPRIWYIGVAGLPGEQQLFYMGRSGDNSWMGFHGATGPYTLILAPADLNPQRLAEWLASEISWIPPYILSGGYTYTISGESQGLPPALAPWHRSL
ncbi:MAG: DUF2341 domain-containing protein [Desulfurococcales archaeon]|nr:DUF2341 domain-containing protein [Desulfurococcales archaeon]